MSLPPENLTMTTEISNIPPTAGDRWTIFPCPINQTQTNRYNPTQVLPGGFSSDPIVIDDEEDSKIGEERSHSPESHGGTSFGNSPDCVAGVPFSQSGHIPQKGKVGLRWSSFDFGESLRSHDYQLVESSGNNAFGSTPPQQHGTETSETKINTVPMLNANGRLDPDDSLASKEQTPRGTPCYPDQPHAPTPLSRSTSGTSAPGTISLSQGFPAVETSEAAVSEPSFEGVAPTLALDRSAASTASSSNPLVYSPGSQRISEGPIQSIGTPIAHNAHQRTFLESLPEEYPVDTSFIVSASTPVYAQPPEPTGCPTESVSLPATGLNDAEHPRPKRKNPVRSSARASRVSRSCSARATDELSDDHITSDSDQERGIPPPKRPKRVGIPSLPTSGQRRRTRRPLDSSPAAALPHQARPTCSPSGPTVFREYSLPNTKLQCVEVDGETTFQIRFTWNACDHTEDALGTPKSQVSDRGQGNRQPRARNATGKQAATTDDSNIYEVDRILTRWGKRYFLVRWADKSCTWEPKNNIGKDLLTEFEGRFEGIQDGATIADTRQTKGGKVQYFVKWERRPESENSWVEESTLSLTLLQEYWGVFAEGGSRQV